ncbi:MAG TPA: L,D-transpeptidase family protein [Stellaceae bacterium]|nr:L,D-transpeptidase family protein [Stellaceae bacterium]
MHLHKTGRRVRARRYGGFAAAIAVIMTAIAPADAHRVAMPVAFHPPLKIDRILVLKSKRVLELLHGGKVVKAFPIALGEHPVGAKRFEGDGKTPEGLYYIDGRLPNSRYHLALHISYPNPADTAQAVALGRDPGGNILIHGLPNWYRGPLDPVRFYKDWTDGCVSVGDRAIEEIYAAVDVGTPVEIKP